METTTKVAIIGSGLTALMAANALRNEGVEDILLIDKARSVGGRLATRRIDNGRVDHGAQFFTVRTAVFQTIVDKWMTAGWVRHWFGDKHPRYLSEGGMNALAKRLAEGIPTLLNARVTNIRREKNGYTLELENGDSIQASVVIVTAPAPQTIELISQVVNTETLTTLQQIQFDPCFVGIFELSEESTFSANGHQDDKLPAGVLRIVDHQKKGISPIPTVSVYMTGDWSAERYEQQDTDVLVQLKEQVANILPLGTLRSEQLKRWRYAQANSHVSQPFLQVADGLFVAGDAFLHADDEAAKTRMESAVLSGLAVAEEVVKVL